MEPLTYIALSIKICSKRYQLYYCTILTIVCSRYYRCPSILWHRDQRKYPNYKQYKCTCTYIKLYSNKIGSIGIQWILLYLPKKRLPWVELNSHHCFLGKLLYPQIYTYIYVATKTIFWSCYTTTN